MNDLTVGLGLMLVFEGLLWGLAPETARKMLTELASLPDRSLRIASWSFVGIGVLLVWLIRG